MDDNFSLGYAMGQNSNGNNGSGWGMNGWGDWILIILLFAILGGGFGGFGFGGFGGGAGFQGMATRADINEGFALNNITSGITAIQQGICDSTYALNNSIMQGFHGVDNAVCNLGYNMQQGFNNLGFQTQQGFNTLGYAVKDCCCETQRMIERGFCDTNYNLATNANNIVQSGRADTDRVIAKLDQMEAARQAEKIEALRMENQTLRVATGVLNEIMTEAVALQQPPSDKGKRLKLYYITQVSVKPPTFVIFVNDKELMHFYYTRYLENKIREAFGFRGTSLKFFIRERKEKEQ